ncbi:hypothetical protein BDR26DRAFT_868747 [Obelidium mucronatum]|nr:hypothetical protein BDR26DRAFT_868747 [Obelidium mucronatum]
MHRFPLRVRLPIQWGDQDATGQLSHIAVYRMFETARLEYFEKLVGPQISPSVHNGFIRGKGIGRILRNASITVLEMPQYPDVLVLGARTKELQSNRIIQEYIAVSEKTGLVAATGEAVIATFDHVLRHAIATAEQATNYEGKE